MLWAGKSCIGIDALDNFDRSGLNQGQDPFLIADMYSLPFEDEKFELVHERMALADILEFQGSTEEDIMKVMKEVYRVLTPDGFFYVKVPNLFFESLVKPFFVHPKYVPNNVPLYQKV